MCLYGMSIYLLTFLSLFQLLFSFPTDYVTVKLPSSLSQDPISQELNLSVLNFLLSSIILPFLFLVILHQKIYK